MVYRELRIMVTWQAMGGWDSKIWEGHTQADFNHKLKFFFLKLSDGYLITELLLLTS